MSSEKYYKEQIRNRMMSFAAAFWDIQKAENFDPIVKLLLEALANEIYLLGEEFNHIETRLLEKTARILTPDIMLAPRPAHCIAHINPLEDNYILDKETGVFYDMERSVSDGQLGTVYFYPSCRTPLYKGDVRYLLYDDLVYKVDSALNKTMVSRLENHTSPQTVWLGMELDLSISNLKDMSFYLELPNVADSYKYLYLLSCSEWYINDKRVTMRRGIYDIEEQEHNMVRSFFEDYELIHTVDKNILNLYKNNYLTVDEDVPLATLSSLPPEYLNEGSESFNSILCENLFWIRIVFPGVFTGKMLEDIRIGINMVPVENKLLRHSAFSIDDTFGVIPLTTSSNEYLLSVHSVRNAKGDIYHELLYGKTVKNGVGHTYSIRRGGCERFNSRSAKNQLEYLYDLLNDEVNAFSTIQSMKLRSHIQQIVQTLGKLREVLDDIHETGEVPCYLFIDNAKDKERVSVDYWVTNADAANGLPAGVALSTAKSSFLNPSTLFLVTSTYGGRREPKEQERINLYKYQLTSRNRILTNDDISNFCITELGELLNSVKIKNGVDIHQSPKGGLVRTKDIYLYLKSSQQDIQVQERIRRDLQIKLEESSPDTFRFRIFIEN